MGATHFSGPVVSTAGFQNGAGSVETLTAASTLTAEDSGKTLLLNLTAGFATTLPEPVAGMRFKFILAAAITGDMTVVTNGGANIFQGGIVVNGASVVATDADTITFANAAEVVGDYVEIESDGTYWWLVGGYGKGAGGITFTAT